jgi:hypothetical protein
LNERESGADSSAAGAHMDGGVSGVELLAALADGRLHGPERERAMALIAESDEDYELYAEILEATGELDLSDAPASSTDPHDLADGVIRLAPRRAGFFARVARWGALAAALAGVALVGPLLLRGRGGLPDPADSVALLESGSTPVVVPNLDRPWRVTRGGGDPLTAEARAARLGALSTDLGLGVRTRDYRVRDWGNDAASMLDDVPGGGPAAASFRALADRAGAPESETEPLLAAARESIADLANADHYRLGGWAEAARIAAARHDVAFFHARRSRIAMERAVDLPSLPPAARESARALVRATRGDGPPDWDSVEIATAGSLTALGSPWFGY